MTELVLRNVSVAFNGHTVINDFSLVLKKGETLVLMGPSGCGKTTLMRLLLGLERPQSGYADGVGSCRCGTVFQEDRLCEGMSAVANLRSVCPQDAVIRQHLKQLGITEAEQEKPVRQLSGGQRRRVSLVRAVLFSSDFLFLDEPFKGLDVDMRETAIRYIDRFRRERGLLLITHDPAEAQIFGGRCIQMRLFR